VAVAARRAAVARCPCVAGQKENAARPPRTQTADVRRKGMAHAEPQRHGLVAPDANRRPPSFARHATERRHGVLRRLVQQTKYLTRW